MDFQSVHIAVWGGTVGFDSSPKAAVVVASQHFIKLLSFKDQTIHGVHLKITTSLLGYPTYILSQGEIYS